MYTIDTTSYNKAKVIPYNPNKPCGYQPRHNLPITSIVVHTTNGVEGSSFNAEATYIVNSTKISSHYLIGKDGRIVQILDPYLYMAYHAGCVNNRAFSNIYSIGIEMHNTPSEGHIPDAMFYALDWLTRQLIVRYSISISNIDTHRNVAVFCPGTPNAGKKGRKIDPSIFPDNEFYFWRSTLNTAGTRYKVINPRGVYIRQSPQVNSSNIAGTLQYNDIFIGDVIKKDELGQIINGSNEWVHIAIGISNGKSIDNLGFVHKSNLIQI